MLLGMTSSACIRRCSRRRRTQNGFGDFVLPGDNHAGYGCTDLEPRCSGSFYLPCQAYTQMENAMPVKDVKKVVLAYSGGLDTSVIVTWLKNNYGCEIICFTADLGQEEELDGLEEKAIKTGASKLYIRDLREEFLTDFVYPTMRAGAIYERDYLLGTSMARPLIAKHLVEIAELEGADAIAHGCTGKGNDQV